jgi:TolA-binding protein
MPNNRKLKSLKRFSLFGFVAILFYNSSIAQGIIPLSVPEFQGTSWTEWANKREFHSADLALRSLQTNLISFQAANSCSEEDLRLLECVKAAYRLDPEVEVLYPAFLRDFPKNSRLHQSKLIYGLYLIRQNRELEAMQVWDSLNWYQLNFSEAQQYHYFSGQLNYSSDTIKALEHWLHAASSSGDFQNHARFSLMIHDLRMGNYHETQKKLDLLHSDPQYDTACIYPRLLLYALRGDTTAALSALDSLSDFSFQTAKKEIFVLGMNLAYGRLEAQLFIGYLNKAVGYGLQANSADTLRLAQMYSLLGIWDTVALLLQRVEFWPDSLTSLGYFVQGQAWLALGLNGKSDRYLARARTSFQKVTELEVDGSLRESAFYNYAKLAYDIGEAPSNFRILASFLIQYPGSIYREEISQCLSDLAMKGHHYHESLRILRGVSHQTSRLLAILQKLYFQQGVTFFNQKRYVDALSYLDSSLLYQEDSSIRAATFFWKSELYHRVGEYNQAFVWMKNFLDLGYFNHVLRLLGCTPFAANYQLGQLSFRLERHNQAVRYMKEAIQKAELLDSRNEIETAMYRDAQMRLGDAFLRDGLIDLAINQFQSCILDSGREDGKDYAYYQLAISFGIQKNVSKKCKKLIDLIQEFPSSNYRIYAFLELATTYYQESNFDSSNYFIRAIESEFPNHRLTFIALNLRGSIFMEQGMDSLAMSVFGEVIQRAAGLPEAKDALFELRQLCIKTSQPQRYLEIVGKSGLLALQDDPMDSILFETAQYSMESGKFFEALATLTQYLKEYPTGSFKANALFTRSIAASKVGDIEMQISDLETLIQMPENLFTERALTVLAGLYLDNNLLTKALLVYVRTLQGSYSQTSRNNAALGSIRVSSQLELWSLVDSVGNIYVKTLGAGQNYQNEISWYLANSLRFQGKTNLARKALKTIADSTRTEWAARALYNLAEMAFEEKKYSESQDLIYDLTDLWPQYTEWYGRGLLLLAENLIVLKEKDQAIAVLTNLIQDRDADAISRLAEMRLKAIRP